MTSPTSQATPSSSSSPPTPTVSSAVPAPARHLPRLIRCAVWCAAAGIAVAAAYFAIPWWNYRLSHSITDDAFVEAHIVNIAPQSVSGHIVRFLVEENERVDQGQLLAEIDPVPYRDQVNIARSKVDTARAELRRQEAGLARLREEVPIQNEIARRTLATAEADQAKAKEALRLTEDEVAHGIEIGRAHV